MAPRQLRVLALDDDKDHAEYMRSILSQFNFHVRVHTSPQSTLNFLKDHAEDVDFLLVAVNMEEMSGFQFLDIAAKMHRNIQVILMSAESTWDIFERAVRHGARFIVKKPLVESAICNMWQYLDLSDRIERIQHLCGGLTGGQSSAESGVTDSSGGHNAAEVESRNNSTSEMEASTGSNAAAQSIVNYPNSGNDETLGSCCEGDEQSKASTSPRN
ncbi:hypothetical protein EJB05_37202, partial [Eragrostis curvula]